MMKASRLILLFFFFITAAWQPAPVNEISVTIVSLRNTKGQVLVSLFKDGSGYPGEPEKAVQKGRAVIAGNKAIITFRDLPAGKYAAVVLHDENSNLKMDKTWLGLPKEGYGFSNNVMGTFGPPSFNKASFRHVGNGQTPIMINLKY